MIGILYLHQKNVFYSDMKPANLLIFRNQYVKMGDFGVSVKLRDDDVEGINPLYYARGQTKGYCTEEFMNAVDNEEP